MRCYKFKVGTPSIDGLKFDELGTVEFTDKELRTWESTQAPYMGKKSSDYRYALALGERKFGHLRHTLNLGGIEYMSALVVEAM